MAQNAHVTPPPWLSVATRITTYLKLNSRPLIVCFNPKQSLVGRCCWQLSPMPSQDGDKGEWKIIARRATCSEAICNDIMMTHTWNVRAWGARREKRQAGSGPPKQTTTREGLCPPSASTFRLYFQPSCWIGGVMDGIAHPHSYFYLGWVCTCLPYPWREKRET